MKHIIILLLACATLLVVSCAKDPIGHEVQSIDLKSVVIEASNEGNATKTGVDGTTGKVFWNPQDEISVFFGEAGIRFVSQNTEPSGTSVFTCPDYVIIGSNEWVGPESDKMFGLYPYNPDAICDGTSITTTLPAVQEACAGTFADNLFITMGCADRNKLSMGFYNVCGGVRFCVVNGDITTVRFRGNNGEVLAGNVKVAFDDGGLPAVQEVTDGQTEIVLTCDGGFTPGVWYYIVTLPVELTAGFNLVMEPETGGRYYFENDTPVSINRSVFGSLEDVDAGLVCTPYIPDANFKAYLVDNFDLDHDGEISMDEAENITDIEIETSSVYTLTGIEFFKNLKTLRCYGLEEYNNETGQYEKTGKLTSLNLSRNTALEYVNCEYNKVTSLDVSSCAGLKELYCKENQISELTLRDVSPLTNVDVSHNCLTSFEMGDCPQLVEFDCSYNEISELDTSSNTELVSFNCAYNLLATLDVTSCTKLVTLSCCSLWDVYNFDYLDLSNCPDLESLDISKTSLQHIDLSCNTKLKSLSCGGSYLSDLDLSDNADLEYLDCSEAGFLQSLNISNNTKLKTLIIAAAFMFEEEYDFRDLDVSNMPELELLDCRYIGLNSLTLGNLTKLYRLDCSQCGLTSLDVSNNVNLSSLDIAGNDISSIDVSMLTRLTYFNCSLTLLSSLDLSSNLNLGDLYCASNPNLTEIWMNSPSQVSALWTFYHDDIATIYYKN